jgi:hypothetical protein
MPSMKVFVPPQVEYTSDEEKISAASRTIGLALILVAGIGTAALWIWACGLEDASAGKPTLGTIVGGNLLVGLAAAAAGAVFGFIFGMPRTMTLADRIAFAKAVKEEGLSDKAQGVMGVNTNLERVSDWLTTLLVGATLVQIDKIAAWIGGLGTQLFKSGGPTADAIVPVVIVFSFSLAFLGIYLITRLYLTSALSLTGGTTPAAAREPNKEELERNIAKAVESDSADDVVAGLKALDEAKLGDEVRKDPMLNATVARALAKLINKSAASSRADPKAELRTAVDNAIADPEVAKQLKTDAGVKSLETGDAELDKEIGAKLGVPAIQPKSELAVLTGRIDAALASGKAEDVAAAFAAIGATTLAGEAKEDAGLNAKIVRLVAKMLQLNAAPDKVKAVDALRAATPYAAKVPAVAKGLRESFDDGSLTTGDKQVDDEIRSKLP